MGLFIQPKNTMPIIEQIWAFVSVDPEDENEGVCAFFSERYNTWVPLIAANEERLVQMRPIAQEMMNNSSELTIRLVKFTTREEVEVLTKEEVT